MILLDTHVLVWLASDTERLGAKARRFIQGEAPRHISAMVAWELAMLGDTHRLSFDRPLGQWIEQICALYDCVEIPVAGVIARDAGSLPGNIHGDPCDRIMIATARWLGCPLATADRSILDYAAHGHVQVLDARR